MDEKKWSIATRLLPELCNVVSIKDYVYTFIRSVDITLP
jgi:hypothetical protein